MAVTIWTIWLLDVFAFLATFFHHRIKINLLLHSACHKTFADYFWKNFSRHWNLTWQKRSSFHTAVALGRKALIYDLITSSLNSREKYLLVCKQKRLSIVTTTHSCDQLKKLSCATGDAMLRDNYHKLKCDTLVSKKYPLTSWKRKKRAPGPCRTESAVLDWNTKPSYVYPLQIQVILRTQFIGSRAFANVRGRRRRWGAHCTPRQAYTCTSTQISQNVVCIVVGNKKLFHCL